MSRQYTKVEGGSRGLSRFIQKNSPKQYNKVVQALENCERRILTANNTNRLSHTKWLCRYHMVIVPKYRRKILYNQTRKD